MGLFTHLARPITLAGSDPAATEQSWRPRRWVWMGGLASITVFALGGLYAVPAAVSSPDYQSQLQGARPASVLVPTTTTTTASTTTTTAPPASPPAVLAAAPVTPPPAAAPPAAAPPPAPAAPALPAYGHASTPGCTAALAYLLAYAAPGFALDCPGYALGHEAMTCLHGTPQYPDACPNGPTIAISDACPQAYMNEAANSWNLTGQLSTEQQKFGASYPDIDPFGACP